MGCDRRTFLHGSLSATAAFPLSRLTSYLPFTAASETSQPPLRSPERSQVRMASGIATAQVQNSQEILATFDDDALLKPFRAMGSLPAPGREIGGWYEYLPDYDWHHGDAGLAPGHCFGQWTSAMARFAATSDDASARVRASHLQGLLTDSITPDFFDKTRYPAYTLDKLNCGLMDAHALLRDSRAFEALDKTHRCAASSLPDSAHERDIVWRQGRDFSYTWDESYTLPENLYLLYAMGAGDRYRTMAQRFLLDSFFDPLARGENILGGLHGYSHCNALCSAMQAWFVDGSQKHLQAALNGYRFLLAQSYATGGFAPDELFVKSGSGKLLASLADTHNSFETPCCTYALLKLSRYLLQATRDGVYGDTMERVLWNTMFGCLPLQPDGRTFYYADNNGQAQRIYSAHRWPCCAGTYTQVAADYGINTWQLGPAGEQSVWVSLYLPSALHFSFGAAQLELTQAGNYPTSERVSLRLHATASSRFTLHLRMPAWCSSPTLSINGQHVRASAERGFAAIDRLWRDGDLVELHLPAALRLEPLPADGSAENATVAALCWGPWVLMPLAPNPTATRSELMKAERMGAAEWRVRSSNGDLYLRPFFAVGESTYATYLRLS